MRLIDADELIEELKAKKVFITGVRNGRKIITELVESLKESFVSVIEEQPTIENKCIWHDLRKNPKALPREGKDILLTDGDNYFCGHTYMRFSGVVCEMIIRCNPMFIQCDEGYLNESSECYVENGGFIAWREIEPFEGEQ